MAEIELTSLRYATLQRIMVHGLDLAIERGQIYGLIGPMHCGKSSVLKMLATLIPPTAGRARVARYDLLTHPHEVRGSIGYLSDFRGAYDDMQVRDYLEFYGLACHVPRDRLAHRIDEVLEQVGLRGRREDYVESLDRAAKQRLGLARAVVHDPPVLLLDDPGAGLDIPARLAIRELIGRLHGGWRTIIIGSNVMTEAAGLCHRLCLMHEGRLLDEGSVTDLAGRQPYVRTLEIRTQGEVAPVADWTDAHPQVTRWQLFDSTLLASIDLALENPMSLIKELQAGGVGVLAVRELEVNLEPATNASTPANSVVSES